MVKLLKVPSTACAVGLVLFTGLVIRAQAQPLPVPCYVFQQDPLGNWTATKPLSMDTPVGDIVPGHRVSVPEANILNARCP